MCYYVMNNGIVEEQQTIFEKPYARMMYHLKPLVIREEVDNIIVNKVFDLIIWSCRTTVNLMLYSLFKKMGKSNTNLRPHNMVMLNYKGKTIHVMGVIHVELSVGTMTRPTMFMVIVSNANYNMLLRREWIHGIGPVPSTLH